MNAELRILFSCSRSIQVGRQDARIGAWCTAPVDYRRNGAEETGGMRCFHAAQTWNSSGSLLLLLLFEGSLFLWFSVAADG